MIGKVEIKRTTVIRAVAFARYAGRALCTTERMCGVRCSKRGTQRGSCSGFRCLHLPGAGITFNLSERSDLAEAASRLVLLVCANLMRLLQFFGLERIAVMPVPDQGLGQRL